MKRLWRYLLVALVVAACTPRSQPQRTEQTVMQLPRDRPAPLTIPTVDGYDEREEETFAAD